MQSPRNFTSQNSFGHSLIWTKPFVLWSLRRYTWSTSLSLCLLLHFSLFSIQTLHEGSHLLLHVLHLRGIRYVLTRSSMLSCGESRVLRVHQWNRWPWPTVKATVIILMLMRAAACERTDIQIFLSGLLGYLKRTVGHLHWLICTGEWVEWTLELLLVQRRKRIWRRQRILVLRLLRLRLVTLICLSLA